MYVQHTNTSFCTSRTLSKDKVKLVVPFPPYIIISDIIYCSG